MYDTLIIQIIFLVPLIVYNNELAKYLSTTLKENEGLEVPCTDGKYSIKWIILLIINICMIPCFFILLEQEASVGDLIVFGLIILVAMLYIFFIAKNMCLEAQLKIFITATYVKMFHIQLSNIEITYQVINDSINECFLLILYYNGTCYQVPLNKSNVGNVKAFMENYYNRLDNL